MTCSCSGTQGLSSRLKPFFYKQETGVTEEILYPGGPFRVLLGVGDRTKDLWKFEGRGDSGEKSTESTKERG